MLLDDRAEFKSYPWLAYVAQCPVDKRKLLMKFGAKMVADLMTSSIGPFRIVVVCDVSLQDKHFNFHRNY